MTGKGVHFFYRFKAGTSVRLQTAVIAIPPVQGMDASMMARLTELEEEHRRLKKMYAKVHLARLRAQQGSVLILDAHAQGSGVVGRRTAEHNYSMDNGARAHQSVALSSAAEG